MTRKTQISKEVILQAALEITLIYTHGLASFIGTSVMRLSEEIMSLIKQAGDNFLMQAGVPADKISKR